MRGVRPQAVVAWARDAAAHLLHFELLLGLPRRRHLLRRVARYRLTLARKLPYRLPLRLLLLVRLHQLLLQRCDTRRAGGGSDEHTGLAAVAAGSC